MLLFLDLQYENRSGKLSMLIEPTGKPCNHYDNSGGCHEF